MTHKLASNENFDIVRGNQTVRVPFAAEDPQSAQVVMLVDKGDLAGKLDSTSAAPAFSTSSTYAVGDHVTYNGALYRCTTAVTTAGAWDASKWTADTVAMKAPNPTVGHLAALDADGNPTDAGYRFEVRNGIPYIIETTND